ncbi:C40 family peptidase [Kribbella sandramycini]|uniref:C40 family peptidase n=1 Tax=Kribbella sandramycini TaxID=60450 RepID=A0A7Y4P4W5_9ACTN|nr:NlpC/P60 family protein [Kribbella sandramycini]MBB6568806.1 cell wall-associated NlpC family hydrolase [Kribbella sandramycini]NOL45575.1 C40 family peptidase [Kribbella sandramycini]
MKLVAAKVPISTVWTAPDAPRDVDAPATAPQPDVPAWAAAMDTESRLGLHGRTLTQLLFAEPVLVRSERDGWSEVLAPWQPSSGDALGYPGWVPSSHLGELPGSATDPVAITVPNAPLLAEPAAGIPVLTLSFGTVLASVERDKGYTRVATPDGGSGWLPDHVLRLASEPSTPDDRLRLGRLFLGLEYLWGGTSAYGLDCSGLTHTVSRVLGMRIPRDAHDQAATLRNIPIEDAKPGDLYFYARPGKPVHHVGFVSPTGMLHASETGKRLEDEPIPADRRATLVAAAQLA